MSPGSLSFAKLVMMSSAPVRSVGDATYISQDPLIQSTFSHRISTQSVLGVRSFYVERIYLFISVFIVDRNGSVVVNFTLVFIRGNKSVEGLLQVLKRAGDNGTVKEISVERETLRLVLPPSGEFSVLENHTVEPPCAPPLVSDHRPKTSNFSK